MWGVEEIMYGDGVVEILCGPYETAEAFHLFYFFLGGGRGWRSGGGGGGDTGDF